MSELLLAVAFVVGVVIAVFVIGPPLFVAVLYIKNHPILGRPFRLYLLWTDYWFEVEERYRQRLRERRRDW